MRTISARLRLIRFGGHRPRGGYDVHSDGRDPQAAASRRLFDEDFKAQAARLVLNEGKTVGAVARDLRAIPGATSAALHHRSINRHYGIAFEENRSHEDSRFCIMELGPGARRCHCSTRCNSHATPAD